MLEDMVVIEDVEEKDMLLVLEGFVCSIIVATCLFISSISSTTRLIQ